MQVPLYKDNNSLAYVKISKLGASQIRWLSKLTLLNFNIQYHSGKSHKATYALSRCPVNSDLEGNSDNESEEPVMFHMPWSMRS